MIRLSSFITKLYTEKEAREIQKELQKFYNTLTKNSFNRGNLQWYKYTNLYVTYPDSIEGEDKIPIRNLANFLPHMVKIGFNALHILPFLDSPMKDGGFDVRNYLKIRKDLGTLNDLIHLKKKADGLGIKIFMDLVFNHVSVEHEWFQKALGNDTKFRNYFIHTKEKPIFLRKFRKNAAVWAEYIVEGKKKLVNVAFPEFAGKIPHWIHGKDGYWYYHTYRPEQIDINWKNPDIFLESAKILIYWANLGFNFRLDAIPFVGKSAYKQINTKTNFTHHLLAALNHLAKQINPECVFILETYEHINTVIGYLGKKNIQQAEMLYGFHLCTSLWVSLSEKNSNHIWKTLKKVQRIPTFALWINFLRNHDELSLAYLDNKSLHDARKAFMKFGKPFREGYGIAGRTMSLLGNDLHKFFMAYFLLLSLPGGILMVYGDEFGKKSTPDNLISKKLISDPRNINRGLLTSKYIKDHNHSEIVDFFTRLFQVRKTNFTYFLVWPEQLSDVDSIFYASYNLGSSELRVAVNLSTEKRILKLALSGYKKIFETSDVTFGKDEIILGPYAGIWIKK